MEDKEEDRHVSNVGHFVSGIRTIPTMDDISDSEDMNRLTVEQWNSAMYEVSKECSVGGLSVHPEGEVCSVGGPSVLSWDRVNTESAADPQISELAALIQRGIPENKFEWPETIKEFYTAREKLSVISNSVCYEGRIIIPRSMRKDIKT